MLATAQTLGKAREDTMAREGPREGTVPRESTQSWLGLPNPNPNGSGTSAGLGGGGERAEGERAALQPASAAADSPATSPVRHALAPLAPPRQVAERYCLERLRAAMRGLFACDDALVRARVRVGVRVRVRLKVRVGVRVRANPNPNPNPSRNQLYIPRDPGAVLKAAQRGAARGGGVEGTGGAEGGMVPLLPQGVRPRTGLASVSGMEALCISGEALVLVASTSAESPRKVRVRVRVRVRVGVRVRVLTPTLTPTPAPALIRGGTPT